MTRLADVLGDYVAQAALAAAGGLIGILMRDEPGGWPHMLLGAVGAGFVGLLIAHGCHAMGLSDDYTFVCVGVGGWLGAERTLSFLERYLLKRFNIQMDSGESKDTDNVRSIEGELRKRERGGKS